MFDWVLKLWLNASIKAVSSTFLTLAAIWLNNFFPFTLIFVSSNIQKRSSIFVVQDFIFIQTKFLFVAKTKQ